LGRLIPTVLPNAVAEVPNPPAPCVNNDAAAASPPLLLKVLRLPVLRLPVRFPFRYLVAIYIIQRKYLGIFFKF